VKKGPHQPLFEKETKPPNQLTEATLLRAMERQESKLMMKIYGN
jgi:hypothetical protein